MRDALVAIIASVIVGLSTFYVEEVLFDKEQANLHDILMQVVERQREQLERCDARND